ncbi:MAG: hydrophobic protein [Chloroflexi bacterium]|nr:MAG: hydrophobic protein [Chloroflexota bacterium]
MLPLLFFLILVALLFGAGAALHALWWVAIIALAVWVVGFLIPSGGSRWYRW